MLARLLPLGPPDEEDLVSPITRRASVRQPHPWWEPRAAPREDGMGLRENVRAAGRQQEAKYPTASTLQCITWVQSHLCELSDLRSHRIILKQYDKIIKSVPLSPPPSSSYLAPSHLAQLLAGSQ